MLLYLCKCVQWNHRIEVSGRVVPNRAQFERGELFSSQPRSRFLVATLIEMTPNLALPFTPTTHANHNPTS